jgi:ADP-ribose pyrophosphatase
MMSRSPSEETVSKPHAKILSRRVIYTGKVFSVRQDVVVEPGDIEATRDVVVHHGSVVLLPILRDGRLVLVRQYRHSAGDFLLEVVAGRMEPGESPLTAARRELAEETGYRAMRFVKMMNVFPTPGFVTERMVAFLATGLTPGPTNPDADERIENKPFPLKALVSMIHKGDIHDMKTVACVLYYARFFAPRHT